MMRKTLVCIASVTVILMAVIAAGPFSQASPTGATGAGAGVTPDGHGMGLVRSEPGLGHKLDTTGPGTGIPLAASVDLSGNVPPVGDQGMVQSCVGWSTGYYYKSWWEKQEHPYWDINEKKYQFSPAFVYNQINGGKDLGASFYDAMNLLENAGNCDYEEFPYSDDYLKQPGTVDKEAAKQYRIPAQSSGGWGYFFVSTGNPPFSRPNVIKGLKAHLNSGRPLVMAMPVYNDFYSCGDFYEYDGSSAWTGGHGVFIAGYDDDAGGAGKGGFLMVNSWGPGWNGDGKVYLSYDFVQEYVYEAWSMEDRDSSPEISSVVPSSASGGSTVVILGDNLGAERRSAKVAFPSGDSGLAPGAGEGTAQSWSNSAIEVSVPVDVGTGQVYVYDWDGEKSNGKSFTGGPAGVQWYLAEGATRPGFEEWVLVQNPNTEQSSVELTMLTPQGPVAGPAFDVAGESRTTVNVNRLVPDRDVAAVVNVTNDVPVCVERAMYVNTTDGKWGSHDSIAAPGVSENWYLAEGATWPGFDEWILVMNPGDEPVSAQVTFQTPGGEVDGPLLNLAGGTRESVHVNDHVPNSDVSTRVECLTDGGGVVAERSMYVRTTDGRVGCHNSMGSSEANEGWALAEGATRPGFEEWVLVQNPTDEEVYVYLFFLTPDEMIAGPEFPVNPGARESVCVNRYLPDNDVSTMVFSDAEGQEIVVERAMYVSTTDGKAGAHNSPGSIYLSTDWYLPEGCTSPGFDEWVLVMNPDTEASAKVQLTFMTPEGPVPGPGAVVGPCARETFHVNDYYAGDVSTRVEADGYVVCERAMYVDAPGMSGSHCSLGVMSGYVGRGSGSSGGSTSALPAETVSSLRSAYRR